MVVAKYFNMTVKDFQGEPCVIVTAASDGEAIIPLRQVQEAAMFHSSKAMEAVSRGEYAVSMKETGVKAEINFDRLEWYAYILKRAIVNREPQTAWDACTCLMSHFEQVYGTASQERQDARAVDSFAAERKR